MNISSINSRLRVFSYIIISRYQEISVSDRKQGCFLSIYYLVLSSGLCLVGSWQTLISLVYPETDHGFVIGN